MCVVFHWKCEPLHYDISDVSMYKNYVLIYQEYFPVSVHGGGMDCDLQSRDED